MGMEVEVQAGAWSWGRRASMRTGFLRLLVLLARGALRRVRVVCAIGEVGVKTWSQSREVLFSAGSIHSKLYSQEVLFTEDSVD